MTDLLAIVLAAGEGTRMKSATPKLLHRIGGLPIIAHVLKAVAEAGATQTAVVIGAGQAAMREAVLAAAPKAKVFEQKKQRGTGDAARQAEAVYAKARGNVVVVYGDHPLLRGENIRASVGRLEAGFDAAVLAFEPRNPAGYGRLITEGERLVAIREHKDASAEERRIGLVNACALAFKAKVFREAIGKLSNKNAQGEFYLTDLIALVNGAGHRCGYAVADENDVVGVNDRLQLAHAEGLFQRRMRQAAMAAGVTLIDPRSVFFSYDTQLAADVTIEPGVFFGPGVTVGEGAAIRAHSVIEGAKVGAGAIVGPHARLRPGTEIGAKAHVGNFVEVKNSIVGEGAKINHLSYVGDSDVGAGTNIGAGTITCNYDGVNKHRTVIGKNVFIGSNSSLVAPVTIADGAYVASGSVITHDVGKDDLAIARGRQENKKGRAKVLRARFAAAKGKKKR